jgi:hypothetical protein
MEINKNFVGSRMNKSLDERLLKPGEYIDAMNIRISSPEGSEAGSAENAKGTEKLVTLTHNGLPLSNPVCIGAFEDGENETIYWFVTSDNVDMIVSYNDNNGVITKHVVSTSVLNFSKNHLVNGINLINDILFFTDNYNQPRKINVKRSYPIPVAGVDQIDEDDISVIVKPPVESPSVVLVNNNTNENYLEDRFIRFAYRYKYKDGEYSALSEFSDLGFSPLGFRIDYSSFDNVGMLNRFNEARVTVNTGDEDVVGLDICFKQSNSNTINVIEKYNKADQNWADNDEYVLRFNNQKIYTALQNSEILRHFDNVPRLAKTQTTMGNRIIYGNYVDGYDIDTTINFTAFGISELSQETILEIIDNESSITIDFTDIELAEGKSVIINLNLVSTGFTGAYPGDENEYQDTFSFTFTRDYDDANDLATSQEFIDAIQLTDTWATTDDNFSLTDQVFSSIVSAPSPWEKTNGVLYGTTTEGGFQIASTTNTITLTLMGIEYEDTSNPGTFAYEGFEYTGPTAVMFSDDQRKSLHSNRDYEVGIEYLDEYGRASTAQVSGNNTVFFDSSTSDKKNKIRVQIDSLAPSWAKRYRFVVKPSKTDYETIYSNFWVPITQETAYWVRLEGDNQTKAKVGDLLIVKKDVDSPTSRLIKTKILDLQVLPDGFGGQTSNPTGLYMKIRPNNFNIPNIDEADTFDIFHSSSGNGGIYTCVSEPNPDHVPGSGTLEFRPIAIPAGSRVELMFRSFRFGSYDYDWAWRGSFIATNDYDSLYDFMKNTNINFDNPYIDSGALGGPTDGGGNKLVFIETIGTSLGVLVDGPTSFATSLLTATDGISNGSVYRVTQSQYPDGENKEREMKVRFYEAPDGRLWIIADGMNNGGSNSTFGGNHPNRNEMGVTIIKGGDPLVFETEPVDNDSEIYYQSHKSYQITNTREHTGNIQSQSVLSSVPAVVDLEMYDCFSFGNGVESYKIRDGLAKPGFKLGARVTSVSEQEYKEAKRYADVTYSGVYNEETNINRLNEFNLGLANFKTLEQSFGPINLLHGRQTDILALQEDKISYILAGKNILSDAVGGGTLTSVPEVLGQQVSRVEEYGCSDMESFASYGGNVFFTDEKRGAVINLTGGDRGEQLRVISSFGMRSWFRDRFIENKTKIKLGAYDPYMDEYVLTFTDSITAVQENIIECGYQISQYESSTPITYTVNLNAGVGTSTTSYEVEQGSAVVSIVYDGTTVISQTITGSGTLDFTKDNISIDTCTISITPTNATYNLTVGCVEDESLTIIRIVKNTSDMEGLTATHSSNWISSGPSPLITPPVINSIEFLDGPLSQYSTSVGLSGQGQFPTDGSTIKMRFVGDESNTAAWRYDRFKYLVSDTLYTAAEIDDLTPLLNTAGGVETGLTYVPGQTYEADFTYSNPNGYKYLYLVWDYVEPIIECNNVSNSFTVDQEGRYETEVALPNIIGDVTFTFDVGTKPARIQLLYVNDIVADSLFIGDGLPDATLESEITSLTGPVYNHEYIGDGDYAETFIVNPIGSTFFTSSDISVSDGSETRANGSGTGQIGVVADYPSAAALASDGQVKLTFFKNATGNAPIANKVKVIVWSANSGENTWEMTTSCPQEIVEVPSELSCSDTTQTTPALKALYNLDANVGTSDGAIVVTIQPSNKTDEIAVKAIKNGVTYNDVVSSYDGFHSSNVDSNYTCVGDNNPGNQIAPVYVWDTNGFVAEGGTEAVNIGPGDFSGSSFPVLGIPFTNCVSYIPTYTMVIPKTETDVQNLQLKIFSFNEIDVKISCPDTLPYIAVDGPYISPVEASNGGQSSIYGAPIRSYINMYKTNIGSNLGYVFNSSSDNVLHNEQVFSDHYGVSYMEPGWYYTEKIWKENIDPGTYNNVFYVDNNGIVSYYDDDGSPCNGVVQP